MLRTLVAAVIVCVGLAGSGQQALALSEPQKILSGFYLPDMQNIGTEMGLTNEVVEGQDGSVLLRYITPEGYQFLVSPEVFDGDRCIGLQMVAFFGNSQGVPLEALNFFNYTHAFTQVYSYDGGLFLTRYIIADYGVPKGNVASNIANFVAVAVDLDQFLRQGAATGSFSATSLNDNILSFGLAPAAPDGMMRSVIPGDRFRKRGTYLPFNPAK